MPVLDRYRSHREIWALQITGVCRAESRDLCILEFQEAPVIELTLDWYRAYGPEVGGYFMRYSDGYESYLGRKAFEEQFTLVDEDEDEVPALPIPREGRILHDFDARDAGGPWTAMNGAQCAEELKNGDEVRYFQSRGQWWVRCADPDEDDQVHGVSLCDQPAMSIASIELRGVLREDMR